MAELKRQTFFFSTGKQIRLYGTGFGITRSFEIGEITPNIFSLPESQEDGKLMTTISNPHRLTKDELLELADYIIRLCMDFKDNLRKYDVTNLKVFNKENIQVAEDGKPEALSKKGGKTGSIKENINEKSKNKNEGPSGFATGSNEEEIAKMPNQAVKH